MKINFKAILALLGILGLITGTTAHAGINTVITAPDDNIRGGSANSVDPIIPVDPSALYEQGVVRSLYAIPAYEDRYIKKEQISVMKYGIPNNPNKKIKRPKEIIVEKYDVPELDEKVIRHDEPVAKYALPEFMNENKPVPNKGEDNEVKPTENNEINTQDPNGEKFVPLLKYAIPYFPDKKEENNEK